MGLQIVGYDLANGTTSKAQFPDLTSHAFKCSVAVWRGAVVLDKATGSATPAHGEKAVGEARDQPG